ncbi:MAG: ribosome recycling factor [Puniceicoccales bacterium]|jgi:ribosome recycling factor|nr:ribosome recycling factor [Puniceicoccales bacterium]
MDAKIFDGLCLRVLDRLAREFATLHAGKAAVAMVDSIVVDVQGTSLRLKEMAAISVPDGRTIAIQPWDRGTAKAIEKAIRQADLGLTPIIDADRIRCLVPETSRERRLELVKKAAAMGESAKVAARTVRRDAMEAWRAEQKKGHISEDELKRREKEVQKGVDACIDRIDELFAAKRNELLTQ